MVDSVTPFPSYAGARVASVVKVLDPPAIAQAVAKLGAHPEYLIFQGQLGAQKVPLVPANAPGRSGRTRLNFNVWDLINDAVDGTGGFLDGSYLVPHELELMPNTTVGVSTKFAERMQLARYDNFTKVICDGPWNSIVSMKDVIIRDAGGHTRLEDFWDDVDGEGTNIEDFLEYTVSQARRFGTGWIFLDRPKDVTSMKDDLTAQPWAYTVPTRNVVWWEFSRSGSLEAVAYRDPQETGDRDIMDLAPLKIWTRATWSRWVPTGVVTDPYSFDVGGLNALGIVPACTIFDEYPGCGKAFGKSNMLTTSRVGLDVFNRDSEIREIERMCAFPVLSVSIEGDMAQAKDLAIGLDATLATNGKFAPNYVEPVLNSIDKLQAETNRAKESAYVNSEMGGLIGHSTTDIQTSSGFHAEVELTKSERRIGKVAASVEAAENKMARLFLALIGEADVKYSISYPRKFGMVDPDRLIDRTKNRLALGLGPTDMLETLKDYYSQMYPRKTIKEVEDLAKAAVDAKAQAAADAAKQFEAAQGQKAGPITAETARQRLGIAPGGKVQAA